jgi:hypothetical protein
MPMTSHFCRFEILSCHTIGHGIVSTITSRMMDDAARTRLLTSGMQCRSPNVFLQMRSIGVH